MKNLFGLVFKTFLRSLKKEFFIKPSEMVEGKFKSQKGSLLEQYIQRLYPEQHIAMHYNGQNWGNLKLHVQWVK